MKKLILITLLATISLATAGAVEPKTFCRFVPERSDDFAWENDKIAFRAYGPALSASAENSGIDCWLKRVDYPIINKWYKENAEGKSYHKDHGEGYDPYKVGASRGCGGVALWLDGKMVISNVFREWKVVKSGKEESVFVLTYYWKHDGDSYKEDKKISIKLGDRLFKTESTFWKNGNIAINLPIAVGVLRHKKSNKLSKNLDKGWVSVWEKLDGSELGTGVLMDPSRIEKHELYVTGKKLEDHTLLITKTDKNGQVQFYAGYGWKKAGEINTAAEWEVYLNGFRHQTDSN